MNRIRIAAQSANPPSRLTQFQCQPEPACFQGLWRSHRHVVVEATDRVVEAIDSATGRLPHVPEDLLILAG